MNWDVGRDVRSSCTLLSSSNFRHVSLPPIPSVCIQPLHNTFQLFFLYFRSYIDLYPPFHIHISRTHRYPRINRQATSTTRTISARAPHPQLQNSQPSSSPAQLPRPKPHAIAAPVPAPGPLREHTPSVHVEASGCPNWDVRAAERG